MKDPNALHVLCMWNNKTVGLSGYDSGLLIRTS